MTSKIKIFGQKFEQLLSFERVILDCFGGRKSIRNLNFKVSKLFRKCLDIVFRVKRPTFVFSDQKVEK